LLVLLVSASFRQDPQKIICLALGRQCAQGIEVIINMKREEGVGPVLMFGLGGIYVETLKDVAFRLAPPSSQDAVRMVKGIRSFSVLEGVRGRTALGLTHPLN
jgi:acetate---CoA ligase (ADP-forming)